MLAMTFNALMNATAALVMSTIFRHLIAASMRHIEIVTNPLALFVPSTVPMKACRQIGSALARLLSTPVFVPSRCHVSCPRFRVRFALRHII